MVVAIGLATILVLTLTSFSMFCSRSFAALYNYVDLDDVNRIAIDKLTRDVRQANRVSAYDTNGMSLTLEDGDAARTPISFVYNATTRTLTRTRGAEVEIVLLKGCDQLFFWIGQRNTDVGGYDVFKAATIDTAKVINVRWVCSRSLFGRKENTENVQTARIVIRKQGS